VDTTEQEDRMALLERELEGIRRRLDALESGPPTHSSPPDSGPPADPVPPGDRAGGLVTYSGSLRIGGQRVKIAQQREHLEDALDADPQLVSRTFAALGSPFRVTILRALLEGPRTSQELQEVLAVGPVGQLYHHLRELQAAGLIVLRRRSVYALQSGKLLGLCLAFIGAAHLVSDQAADQPAAATAGEG
jgi:DNA-binding transcriptional ArsR family regulator